MDLLMTPWVYWYSRIPRCNKKEFATRYEQTLVPIIYMNTLEEFLNAYPYIKRPSQIQPNMNIGLFRSGSKPLWETNFQGGILMLRQRGKSLLDLTWEKLVFACIGGEFQQEVDGVYACAKFTETIIQIWVKNIEANQKNIAAHVKRVLGIQSLQVFVKSHKESLKQKSSIKNAYTITV